jgi:hypothetical protein
LEAVEQLAVGGAERLDALALQCGRLGVEIDPGFVDPGERRLPCGRIGVERPRHLAVVAERPERLLGHGVDGSYQLVHVEHVGVTRVLGACARPERPLGRGTQPREPLPLRTGELGTEVLVGDAGARDRDMPAQRLVLGELRVDLGVDPRQEERGDRGDSIKRLARRGAGREAAQIRVYHLVVSLD